MSHDIKFLKSLCDDHNAEMELRYERHLYEDGEHCMDVWRLFIRNGKKLVTFARAESFEKMINIAVNRMN